MNWTDEELDKLFQESAKQMKTPYQESFWTEVETLLPEQKKKKLGFGWFFTAGILVILGVSALLFNQLNGKESVRLAQQEPKVTPQQLHKSVSNSETVAISTVSENTAKSSTGAPQTKSMFLRKSKTSSVAIEDNQPISIEDFTTQSPVLAAISSTTNNDNSALVPLTYLKNETWKSPSLVNSNWMQKAPERKHSMYVQLGSGMAQSYLVNQGAKWVPTFNVSTGYQYRKNNIGFSAGVQLTSAMDHNIVMQRTSQVYNYSVTDYIQTLNYRQVYLVEMPLSVDFKSKRQMFSIGLSPTYLASTVMHFSQLENGKVAIEDKYIGQRIGLNSWGLKPSLSYQLEVAKSWQLGVQLNAQVMKQIDFNQVQGTVNKLPITGQITIRKTLTK